MTIDVLKRLALDAEQHERWEDALNLYRLALADAEENHRTAVVPPLQVRVGDLLVRLGQRAAALPLFERAGHAYAQRGRGPEVAAIGDRVVRATSNGAGVFLDWAGVLVAHGHTATATAVLEVFLRRTPAVDPATLRAAAATRDTPVRDLVERLVRAAAADPPVSSQAPTVRLSAVKFEDLDSGAGANGGGPVEEARTGNTEPRLPGRVDQFKVRPPAEALSPAAAAGTRPGTRGWRQPGPPPASEAGPPDPDRLLVPQPFDRDTPLYGDDRVRTEEVPPVRPSSREPFFRRTPRSRWRPVAEFVFWVAAAAVTVLLLLKSGLF